MNILSITGNLVRDLELRKTPSGVSVVTGSVAVQRAFKDKDGNKGVDYIDFVGWNEKAEYLSKYAKKGDRLEISGRLESRNYTDKNNQKRIVWECIIENVMVLSKDSRQNEEVKQETAFEDDDLPF